MQISKQTVAIFSLISCNDRKVNFQKVQLENLVFEIWQGPLIVIENVYLITSFDRALYESLEHAHVLMLCYKWVSFKF